MDRLDAMQIFVAVAEQHSFAAAARHKGLSAAGVTRAVAALESRLGARLLHRTTRAVRLTEAGTTYLADCKRILAEVDSAEALATRAHTALTGQLSITAPLIFGRLHVAPLLQPFLKRHAAVSMRVLFTDHVLDFFEQNIDIAIRIAHLPDSSLRAIRVGTVRHVLCAAPAYLRSRGTPRHPHELSAHELIAFSGQAEPQAWSFAIDGKLESLSMRPRLIVNNADTAIVAARAGQGFTRLLSYQIADDLEQKRLRIVLSDYEPTPVPVYVVHAEGRSTTARVRAFVDFAVERLPASIR